MNKSLSGTQKVELDDNGDIIIYEIKKIAHYRFNVTTKDLKGNLIAASTEMKLKVRENGRCYFYNPLVEGVKNHMKVGPVYLKPFTLGRKIIKAKPMNAEGMFMALEEI